MKRRSFLGIVASVPFLALFRSDPWQRIKLPYRMCFSGPGFMVQAPGVVEIVRTERGFKWIAEPLELAQACRVDRTTIYTPEGHLVSSVPFPKALLLIPDDILKVTQEIYDHPNDFVFETPEDMVKAALSLPLDRRIVHDGDIELTIPFKNKRGDL